MSLGTPHTELPTITLEVNAANVPNCIPSNRRYLYLDDLILNTFKKLNFNSFQTFKLSITDEKGDVLNSTHKLVNITNVIYCIDEKKSELVLDENENDKDLNIIDIKSLKLDYSKIKDNVVFRLGRFETLLIFREDVVTAFKLNKCTGLQFFDADGYNI